MQHRTGEQHQHQVGRGGGVDTHPGVIHQLAIGRGVIAEDLVAKIAAVALGEHTDGGAQHRLSATVAVKGGRNDRDRLHLIDSRPFFM